MKKLLLVLMTFLVACNGSLDAILTVHQDILINFEKYGQKNVSPGDYEIVLSMNKSKKYFNLEFQNVWDDKDPDARFSFPEGLEFPERNGTFSVDHRDTGQNLGLEGLVKTEVTKSEPRRDWEVCQERRQRQYCYVDNNGNTRCYWRDEWVDGRRDVEYIDVRTNRSIDVRVMSPALDEVAIAKANEVHVRRDYIYEGFCRIW